MKNFRFSSYQKVGDCFYWKNFTSTSLNVQIAQKFKKSNGTIFHINSISGKNISLFSIYQAQQEVLFLPFTYFIVEQIARYEEYDEVWLSEMQSPVSYKKNIIVWVDDIPKNNEKYIASLLEKNLQVVQLVSTKMAMQWASEFNWLLNWMDVKFKVISDMVRIENGTPNYYAGIDLLEQFYNIQGYSTPILVFCSDDKMGN